MKLKQHYFLRKHIVARLIQFMLAIGVMVIGVHAHADANPCAPPAMRSDASTASVLQAAARQFAACVQEVGIVAATDKYVDENGWMVTPRWGALRPRMMRVPSLANDRLDAWTVINQELGPASDLLIQIGRWQSADNGDAGDFLVAWRAAPNRNVRVAFGMLIRDAAFAAPLVEEAASASAATAMNGRAADVIMLGELQFGSVCGASGMSIAFDSFGATNVMVMRTGGSMTNKIRVVNDARTKTERWRYITQQSAIDNANALAYVFGRYSMTTTEGETERGYFARIWKVLPGKDPQDASNWRVIVDAASPLSRSAGGTR